MADFKAVLRINPQDRGVNNSLAWLLATGPDDVRDGEKALDFATSACELSKWESAYDLDTLAAAYAETGQFDQAVRWQKRAVERAPQEDQSSFRSRLELYQAGKPFRDKAEQE